MHESISNHPRANVLGVRVSAIDLLAAVRLAEQAIAERKRRYICVAGVHGVMEAQSDAELMGIFNRAALIVPDGMPLTWIGRLQGHRTMDRVFGPDLMTALCEASVTRGYRHFLYGGQPGVAQLLRGKLQHKHPGLQIVGMYTPPFGPLSAAREEELFAKVREARPHIFWVGISTPKQERFMAHYVERLNVPLMVGVGAAFDFHTGRVHDAPRWIKRAGLQWLHRTLQDPMRLGPRYLRTNPAFLWRIAGQLAGFRHPTQHASPSQAGRHNAEVGS